MSNQIEEMSASFMQMIEMIKEDKLRIEKLERDNSILVKNNNNFAKQIKDLHGKVTGIILDEENANRNGRVSSLSEEDVEYIKQCRADGLSLRKIGEMMEVSHTTIANNLKRQSVKEQSNFTVSDDSPVTKFKADEINDLPENGNSRSRSLGLDKSGLDLNKAKTISKDMSDRINSLKSNNDIGSDNWS